MRKKIAIFLILALVFISVGLLFHNHSAKHQDKQPITVKIATVIEKEMPIIIQEPGTIEASKLVNIRAQITGTLKKIDFTEGQFVSQGQPLFEIDVEPYKVKLNQAQATLIGDEAQLKSLTNDLNRFASLVKLGYVTKQEYEQEQAKVAAAKATAQFAQGNVNDAKINLQYTKISSPITGKTGNIFVKEGDLITAASNDPLVVVSQMDPVLVNFHVPQDSLASIVNHQNQAPLTVEVWSENQQQLLGKGKLVFVDNAVDKDTGMVLLKASVDNSNQALWPNLMTNVKLILATEAHAMVVPIDAVKIGQQGNFVYIANDNKAVIKKITVLRRMDNLAVISGEVVTGDKVITVAPPDLDEGSVINY